MHVSIYCERNHPRWGVLSFTEPRMGGEDWQACNWWVDKKGRRKWDRSRVAKRYQYSYPNPNPNGLVGAVKIECAKCGDAVRAKKGRFQYTLIALAESARSEGLIGDGGGALEVSLKCFRRAHDATRDPDLEA